MCLKIYGHRTYYFLLQSPCIIFILLFFHSLHPALSSSHLFLSLYGKSPTITSFSLSFSDSLQCNYTACPLKHAMHAHIHTHAHSKGKLVYNISCCNCSFLDCSSVTTSLWRKEQESSRYFVDLILVQSRSQSYTCTHARTYPHPHTQIYTRGNRSVPGPFITRWHAAPVTCMSVRVSLCVHGWKGGTSH